MHLYIYQICLMKVKCLTKFITHMIIDKHQEIYLNIWMIAVGYYGFHFYGFFIMNISVCFLEKSSRSFFMVSSGPGTEILVPILTFVHDGRGTSTNVHPYLRDERSSSFTASKHNLFYVTGDLASFWTTS